MAQFDVYRNGNAASRDAVPYLLDVQNALLDHLATRVVVPLVGVTAFGRPAARLNPVFEIEGAGVVMSTAEIAGVHHSVIGDRIASLAQQREAIVGAMDVLVSGV